MVMLLVNSLTAFNLTRIFGLVFCGQTKPKTRRAPEVPWLMAVPMVSVTIMTLLVPLMLVQWQVLPDRSNLSTTVVILLMGSSLAGCGLGGWLYLRSEAVKPVDLVSKSLRDMLAYDFWMERVYRLSVVFGVVQGSRLAAWFDRYIVDGMVNFMGFASIFSGESLKYTISGQTRHYLLTVFVGVALALMVLQWSF
jgi:NAD(P)H-quinone oxidoreductase subunit 5